MRMKSNETCTDIGANLRLNTLLTIFFIVFGLLISIGVFESSLSLNNAYADFEICDNGVDEPLGDDLVDCADPECDGLQGPNGQTCQIDEGDPHCDDGEDNDGDGMVDCDDDDCDVDPACDDGDIPPTDGDDNLSEVADLSLCEFEGLGDGFCLRFTATSNIEDVAISINIAEDGDIDLDEITTLGGEGAVCVNAEDGDGDETILLVPGADIVCTMDALNGVFEIQVAGCAEDQDGPLDLVVDLVSDEFPGQRFIGLEQFDTDFQCDDSDSCALVGSVSTSNLAGLALYALIPAAILVRRLRRKQS